LYCIPETHNVKTHCRENSRSRLKQLLHVVITERYRLVINIPCLYHSATETVYPPSALGINASLSANLYGKHPTWPMYMDVSRSGPCLPDTTTVPHVGILRSLLFDPGTDFSHLHDLTHPSNRAPMEEVLCNYVTMVNRGISFM
jgi:hypothetical protein